MSQSITNFNFNSIAYNFGLVTRIASIFALAFKAHLVDCLVYIEMWLKKKSEDFRNATVDTLDVRRRQWEY